MSAPGRIVVLNGAPRSGKSSIVAALQARGDGCFVNLGVDMHMAHMLPPRLVPGIGLRPGGERPDLEPLVATLCAALYESIAAHSRLGLDVVADLGHHDTYSRPLGILADCARRLAGLPALLVGIRCPLGEIMRRRALAAEGRDGLYLAATADGAVPEPVRLWQQAVHQPGIYDLEIDTSVTSPVEAGQAIMARLAAGIPRPSAFERLAAGQSIGPKSGIRFSDQSDAKTRS